MNRRFQKRNKIVLILIIFMHLVSRIGAQEIFDLNRSISAGLEQNYSIKMTRNQEQIASNNVTLGNAGYLPNLTTTNRFGGNVTTTVQNMNDGSQNISSGIRNTTGSAVVNLDMPIFRGFNVKTTYQKLNELRNIGELNTQMEMEDLVSQIVSQYYALIQQQSNYKNMEYAVSLSRERARIDEERYLLGASSKLELLQSIVYLNADSSNLSRQKEVVLASEMRLKKLMALENLDEEISLKDTSILIYPDLNYDSLLVAVLTQNTELQIARKNQAISELDYKIIASRAYPYLNLTSSYNYSYRGYGTGTISDYGELAMNNQQSRALNYGLTLGMDLFTGLNHRREKTNARIEIQNREYLYKDIEQNVKANLITIYFAYQNNLQLLKMEEQNLSVANENLGIALERYKLGNLSGLDLREVQKSLLDAEERLITIQYQTKLAEISLLLISGNVMSYAL